MKKIRIHILEREAGKAETLAARLNEKKGVLDNFDVDFAAATFDYEQPFSPVSLSQAKPGMYIMDYHTANLRLHPSDLPIAEQIRKKYPFLPILLTHRGDMREKYRISTEELSNRKVEDAKVFDGFIDPNDRTTEIQRTVKTNLRQPLNLGILGLGVLGTQFLEIFTITNEVDKIKGYSEHTPYDPLLELIDSIQGRKGKISLVNTLEEALEDTDCVLICTSAVRSSSLLDRLAERDDRLDLLMQEGAKLFSYLKKIKQANYQGLITPFTNPVAGILQLGKMAGIRHGQLTSPMSIDNARVNNAIREDLGKDYDIYINALLEARLVRGHGVPDFQLTDKKTKSRVPIDHQKALARINEVLTRALIRAREMPKKAFKGATALDKRGYVGTDESARFYKGLAHLDETPNESAYCYYKINGCRGFTGLPVKISYFPNIRVSPNEDYIKDFNDKTRKNLKDQLTLQKLYIKELISSGKLGENK